MKSSVDRLDDTTVKLDIEVPLSEMEKEFDRAYAALAHQVNIPGFRRGKAPRKLIEARVPREGLIQDVYNEVIPNRLQEAIISNELSVLGNPEINITSAPADEALVFDATFSVKPEFEVPDFAAIEVTVDPINVTDEKIDEEIDKLRTRFATLKDVKRKSRKGDVLSLNIKVEVDGKELPEAAAEGLTYTIGEGNEIIDGLDKAVKGLKADEEATFETDSIGVTDGKTASVTVTVTGVKARELPELNEEFVQEASEFDTVEELRESIKTRLEDEGQSAQAVALRDAALKAAFEKAAFPLPARYVEQQIASQLENTSAQFGGVENFAKLVEAQGTSFDDYKKNVEEQVSEAVRTQILLDAVADIEEPEVSQEDVNDHIIFTARSYGMEPQTLLQQLSAAGQLPSLFQDVRRGKALAAAICKITAKDTEGNVVDTTQYFGEETADEAEKTQED